MSAAPPSVSRYIDSLVLLQDALAVLDELKDGIAAAHLCMVIDLVEAKVGQDSVARH